jgi:hypothetical protein
VLFIREYLKKSSGKAGNIIIYPKHLAGPAVYEIRGRRLVAGEIQHREECFEEAHADGITVHWFIRTSGTEGCLEKALNRWEKFDCIIFKPEEQDPQAKRNTDFPIIKSWLGKRCRLTISNDFGTVWSCLRTQDGA